MLADIFSQLYDTLYSLVVSIPLNNTLSYVYVILDTVAGLLLSLFGYSGTGGSIFGSIF